MIVPGAAAVSPGVVSACNSGDGLFPEFSVRAVSHPPQLADVKEWQLAFPLSTVAR